MVLQSIKWPEAKQTDTDDDDDDDDVLDVTKRLIMGFLRTFIEEGIIFTEL